jgi:hypothetical protein
MKKYRYYIQDRKSVSSFDKWNFGSYWEYRFCCVLAVATAAGKDAKAEAPGSVINEFFINREEMFVVRT